MFYRVVPVVARGKGAGLVELFILNSNLKPEGEHPRRSNATAEHSHWFEVQKAWLQMALQQSTAGFKVVMFHHPPFSTAVHDPLAVWMDWPFAEWGASLVLNGHQHTYERIHAPSRGNLTFIVNGLGGNPWIYEVEGCHAVSPGSQFRYNRGHGAQMGVVRERIVDGSPVHTLHLCFYGITERGKMLDHTAIPQSNNGYNSSRLKQ